MKRGLIVLFVYIATISSLAFASAQCQYDSQCSENSVCLSSTYTFNSLQEGQYYQKEGDMKCHLKCSKDSDCSNGEMCRAVSIIRGDVGDSFGMKGEGGGLCIPYQSEPICKIYPGIVCPTGYQNSWKYDSYGCELPAECVRTSEPICGDGVCDKQESSNARVSTLCEIPPCDTYARGYTTCPQDCPGQPTAPKSGCNVNSDCYSNGVVSKCGAQYSCENGGCSIMTYVECPVEKCLGEGETGKVGGNSDCCAGLHRSSQCSQTSFICTSQHIAEPPCAPIIIKVPNNGTNPSGTECLGCLVNSTCYPIGFRVGTIYCSGSKNFAFQLQQDKSCENNFECQSKVCVSGKCISVNLIQKIIGWFKNLFGF